jgi:hypothetical protein
MLPMCDRKEVRSFLRFSLIAAVAVLGAALLDECDQALTDTSQTCGFTLQWQRGLL